MSGIPSKKRKRSPDFGTNYIPLKKPKKSPKVTKYNNYKAMVMRGDTTVLKLLEEEVKQLDEKLKKTVKLWNNLKKVAKEEKNESEGQTEDKNLVDPNNLAMDETYLTAGKMQIDQLKAKLEPGETILELLDREIRRLEKIKRGKTGDKNLRKFYRLKDIVAKGQAKTAEIERNKQMNTMALSQEIKQEPPVNVKNPKRQKFDPDEDPGTMRDRVNVENIKREKFGSNEDPGTTNGRVNMNNIKHEKIGSDDDTGMSEPVLKLIKTERNF